MENRPPEPPDGAPDIADASALFADSPPVRPVPSAPPPGPADDPGVFDVEGPDEPEPADPTPPVPFPDAPRAAKAPAAAKPRLEPSAAVEQVWTRGAEWGGTLALLAAVAAGLFLLLYATVSAELYALAFLILLAGGLALAVLSYPILITLERPVRMTPEQAVADYFAALSHHVPHYKRMWLLLSAAGRVSGEFASPEGFRSYWKARLAGFKSGRARAITPLKFQVVDFRSEKSAGKNEIDAKFTVRVWVRGRMKDGPVEEFRVSTSLARGPDRMWYLDRGTLP